VVAVVASSGIAAAAPLALVVADARLSADSVPNTTVVDITLSPDSGKAFAAFTAAHVGDKVAIMVDGRAVMTPILRDPITGGVVEISGAFDRAEWLRLADRLKQGTAHLAVDTASE
jgi:preprotein translocase subunit SecD